MSSVDNQGRPGVIWRIAFTVGDFVPPKYTIDMVLVDWFQLEC